MDYIPTSLIKYCSSVFSDLIARLANLSFSEGKLPSSLKAAQVTPLLKKPDLNKADHANYRPNSNLNNISKLLEHHFLSRIQSHFTSSSNFNPHQSAYRRNHSNETSLLLTLDNVFHSADTGKSTILVQCISGPQHCV